MSEMGLSTSHKLTPDDINGALSQSDTYSDGDFSALVDWLERYENIQKLRSAKSKTSVYVPAKIKVWDGGSLATVSRDKVAKQERKGGGPRDVVKEFSINSRRRLQRTIAQTKRRVYPVFVTLTYPSEYPTDFEVYKEHLRAFAMRYGRKFPKGAFVWRLEFQKRGAPHYHLLCYGARRKELREWVSQAWYEIVGSGDEKHLRAGTRVEQIRSWKHLMAYCSKVVGKVLAGEMSKDSQATDEYVGRWWGVYFRAKMPWASPKEYFLEDREAVQMIRYFRRYARLKFPQRAYRSLTVFLDAVEWLKALPRLAVPDPPRRFVATGRPFNKPFYAHVLDGGLGHV